MIARVVWSRRLTKVNDYRVESRDLRRHGNMEEPLKDEVISRRIVTGKPVRQMPRPIIRQLLVM